MSSFYSLIDMGEGLDYYIFDKERRTYRKSVTPLSGYPEYMLCGCHYRSPVGLWPWWWGYRKQKESEK